MPLLRSKVSTVSSPPCHLTEDALVAGFSGNGGADTLLWVEDVSTLALSVMEVPLVLAQDEVILRKKSCAAPDFTNALS